MSWTVLVHLKIHQRSNEAPSLLQELSRSCSGSKFPWIWAELLGLLVHIDLKVYCWLCKEQSTGQSQLEVHAFACFCSITVHIHSETVGTKSQKYHFQNTHVLPDVVFCRSDGTHGGGESCLPSREDQLRQTAQSFLGEPQSDSRYNLSRRHTRD